MKKIISLTFSVSLAAMLVGCSKNDTTNTTPTQPTNPIDSTKINDSVATIPPSNVTFSTATFGIKIINGSNKPIVKIRLRYASNIPYLLYSNSASTTFPYFYLDTVTTATECTMALKGIVRNSKFYVCATAITSDGTTIFGNVDSFTTPRGFFVGDTLSWGYVFYVDSTYIHGMAYALTDQSSGIAWWNGLNMSIPGASGTAVGTGLANTNAIVAAQGSGTYAASICRNYTGGGFHDWYLPSKGELNILNPIIANILVPDPYWSSTQSDAGDAYRAYYNPLVSYYEDTWPTNTALRVRAVRSF